MDRVRNLLEQIQSRLDDLNKAERKVAEVILHDPQQATRFSIAALAQAAGVSEPTVNRFCRSFGVSGYPELKLQLAQSLASGAAYVSRAVEADDNPDEREPGGPVAGDDAPDDDGERSGSDDQRHDARGHVVLRQSDCPEADAE